MNRSEKLGPFSTFGEGFEDQVNLFCVSFSGDSREALGQDGPRVHMNFSSPFLNLCRGHQLTMAPAFLTERGAQNL